MRNLLWGLILLAVAALTGCGGDHQPPPVSRQLTLSGSPLLLPVPKSTVWLTPPFTVDASTDIVSYADGGLVGHKAALRVQQAAQDAGLGNLPARLGPSHATGDNHIVLRPPTPAEQAAQPHLADAEGYLLKVRPTRVELVSSTPRGLFCAAQTLAQMLTGPTVPGCLIADWPSEAFRALHFTVNPDMYRDPRIYPALIELAARLKYNAIIVQFQSTVELQKHPEAVRQTGVVSQATVRQWVALAKSYGMEIFPEIKSWGHADWTWGLGNVFYDHDTGPDFPLYSPMFALPTGMDGQNTFCVTEPKAYRLLTDTYTEMLSLFGDPKYLHIGGDEAFAMGYRQGQKWGDPVEDGLAWLKRLDAYLRTRGAKMVMWGDMLLDETRWMTPVGQGCNSRADCPTAKMITRLPKDIIIADWHYRVKPDYLSLKYFQDKGFTALGACYGLYGKENITHFNRRVVTSQAMGMIQATFKLLHTDTGFIPYGAECAWNGGQRTEADLGIDLDTYGHQLLDPLLYAGWQTDCLDFRGGKPIYPPFTTTATRASEEWGP